MATTNLWYVDSTMIIELRNLVDALTGDAVTTATVQATLLDDKGAQGRGFVAHQSAT